MGCSQSTPVTLGPWLRRETVSATDKDSVASINHTKEQMLTPVGYALCATPT
jgi:hypothetical protein